jgi:polyisoprenoid-binding protein YceI
MNMRKALLALLTIVAMPAFADNYTVDPIFTIPAFDINHLGFATLSGRFNKSAGRVSLDIPARQGSVNLTIYTGSIDMGSPGWSAHLMSEGLFNVEKFPTMTFTSSKLVFSGDRVIGAEGQFTMLGVSRPISLAIEGFRCITAAGSQKTVCGADVRGKLKRSDFGLAKYLSEVSDEIMIRVPFEVVKD